MYTCIRMCLCMYICACVYAIHTHTNLHRRPTHSASHSTQYNAHTVRTYRYARECVRTITTSVYVFYI